MTEAEWLASSDSLTMLDFVRNRASVRKRRLFSSACFGRLGDLLPEIEQKRGVAALEQWADGILAKREVQALRTDARRAIRRNQNRDIRKPVDDPHFVALMLYRELLHRSIAAHAVQATAGLPDGATERRHQTNLARCIFGNPFRPVAFDPAWRTETAVGLARGIYDDRAFERLPILADALQEAGCEVAEVLTHCREPATHVRGCWVVDLVLGKG